MDEHSGGFLMLAIGNDATVDIGAHICHRISGFVFFRRIPRSEIAGSSPTICSYYIEIDHSFLPIDV